MWFFLIGVILSVVVYFKLIKPCSYWKDKGVVHVRSWPFVGSFGKVILKKKHLMDISVDIYNKFPNERYVGYMQFTRQVLLIRDVDLIKQLVVKDFGSFHDHAPLVESETDPFLSKSLVTLKGEKWRELRAALSPAFTSSKMKNMYVLIEECAKNFVSHYQTDVEVELKNLFSKFANDVIATVAFGIKIDSLKEPTNEFFAMGLILSDFTSWQLMKTLMSQTCPTFADRFGIEIIPKHVTAFFRSIIKDNIKKREEEGIVRPDLIHLLMEARKGKLKAEHKNEKNEGFAVVEETEIDADTKQMQLTDDHIVAQAVLFFFAGFDTVSTVLSFLVYELAINPDAQKKLQDEIDVVDRKFQGKVPYEILLSMKYLDQVLSESLRLWPPAFQTDRLCVKNYLIEPKTPEEKPFLIEKGVAIVIPNMALHRDPQYYPEPHRFDPERFSEENRTKIVPNTYLPFGLGPRNCIGSRLAILELKTLIYHLLLKFDVVPIAKTQIPLKISPKKFSMGPENGMWVELKPRNTYNTS